jgi:hypothetical protein
MVRMWDSPFLDVGRGANQVHVQVRETATGYLNGLPLGGDVDCGFTLGTILAVLAPGCDI